ncbi:hypothetical protein F6Q07_06010 [Pectobacterium parmentieri]|uniref:Uncharacterized protein n=1 Tax=Pectobacterium parmentieri TaxID=1905730 RepID=A0A8B3F586_PECPM|nr:hypothetical protein C5E24_05295 [Pectobacterium parmentieri]AYH20076.1 hypothetical protein C5E22_17210 [Pectobacterium parmentieri]AYH35527.1 hypothetical protein C5E17_05460 [Pectobacterium parmentieri]AZS55594.1 hypothetical protein C5E18_05295 [Pectobacterium parmentieri]MBI0517690.1 hypothetical protein [Pectobacterium parmentieri]
MSPIFISQAHIVFIFCMGNMLNALFCLVFERLGKNLHLALVSRREVPIMRLHRHGAVTHNRVDKERENALK